MAQQEQVVVVEFLGGTVEKESVCWLKRTFGKVKWRGGSLEPLVFVIL